jgi:hypothetical protein
MTNCYYLAASTARVRDILDDPVIEAVIAYPDDPAQATDSINRPLQLNRPTFTADGDDS